MLHLQAMYGKRKTFLEIQGGKNKLKHREPGGRFTQALTCKKPHTLLHIHLLK